LPLNHKVKEKEGTLWLSLNSILFQLLIFLLPTQLSLHFWPKWSFIYGIRIDYFSPTLYLTDIVLIATLATWLLSKPKLSIHFGTTLPFFIFLNIFFAESPKLALYKWLKLLEFSLLIFFVYRNKGRCLKLLKTSLSFAVIYTTILSVLQLSFQKSLGGIFYYLGERTFSVSSIGIALARISDKIFLRPYATFPHPNVLAGFGLVSIFLLLSGSKTKKLHKLAAALSLLLVLISFSKNAWLVGAFALAFFVLQKKLFKKQFLGVILFSSIIFSLFLPLLSQWLLLNFYSTPQFLRRRLELSMISGKIFSENPFFGAGLGNFIFLTPKVINGLQSQLKYNFEWWLQPVHNIFLLVLSETGFLGLLAFVYLIWKAFINLIKTREIGILISLLIIIFTGLNDHYWLTLQQGELLFSIILGFSLPKLVK
jgi:O-antigen ligase